MWNVKTKVIPVTIGATGSISIDNRPYNIGMPNTGKRTVHKKTRESECTIPLQHM